MTNSGFLSVKFDLYDSTIGGKPTVRSACADASPCLLITLDFLHQGAWAPKSAKNLLQGANLAPKNSAEV
uniref:Uncharacterized protein n=1 Tax=Romanomermis culicivorax TaxID=13658 RepID=A0A915JNZ1_ROMCU